MIDDKVETARYGYIVSRKDYYLDLIREMEELNLTIDSRLSSCNSMLDETITINLDKQAIYDKLYECLEGQVVIDGKKLERKQP